MPVRWLPDQKGDETLILELAGKLAAFADHVVETTKPLAPFGTGVHVPRLKKRPIRYFHYRDTIKATTYIGGKVLVGEDVKTPTYNPATWAIAAVVYTTATPLGHIYEVTGAGPHDIPIPITGDTTVGQFFINVRHPGVSRRPHFVPGLFVAAGEAGTVMAGKVISSRGGVPAFSILTVPV